jgi:anti-sigma regulatory factor (Ser/Thr protein kinase)
MTACVARESWRLSATPEASRRAREAREGVCPDLDAEQMVVAKVLTSELVANAVRHAVVPVGAAGTGEIAVVVVRTVDTLRVEVHDGDPSALPQAPAFPSESGWGLHFLEQFSTSCGSFSLASGRGKAVWFELTTSAR